MARCRRGSARQLGGERGEDALVELGRGRRDEAAEGVRVRLVVDEAVAADVGEGAARLADDQVGRGKIPFAAGWVGAVGVLVQPDEEVVARQAVRSGRKGTRLEPV